MYTLLYAVIDKKELVGIYDDESFAEKVIEKKRPKAKVVRKYLNMEPV